MRTFLIDQNLPARLGDALPGSFRHAQEFGDQPTDSELWKKAREAEWTIITRDVDFFNRLALMGPPPKVVWIRFGNIRRRELCTRIEQAEQKGNFKPLINAHPR